MTPRATALSFAGGRPATQAHHNARAGIDLTPLITHRFALNDIQEAYAVFGERRDGVIKVALRP
jgi:threonine dehydrogenase-like Zn-dependent dehydrogenase